MTRKNATRDGALAVVHRDGDRFADASSIAPTLQAALDDWAATEPKLRALAKDVDEGRVASTPIDFANVAAPLPRAYEWVDGSAYIHHIVLVRKARGAEPPATLLTDPLVYQGGASITLGPRDPIPLADPTWGCDFESEIAVILGDVPQGTSQKDAMRYARLFVLVNDVTLRNLIPDELAKGFGFFQSKPASAFSPFAITPDELGVHLRDGRVHLPLRTSLNGALAGDPNAGPEMHFSFADLIAHISKTRSFAAGTILGSGTVSNEDAVRGVSCLAEKRTRETLLQGKPQTAFLQYGDTVRIEMVSPEGRNLFGAIEQKVIPYEPRQPQ